MFYLHIFFKVFLYLCQYLGELLEDFVLTSLIQANNVLGRLNLLEFIELFWKFDSKEAVILIEHLIGLVVLIKSFSFYTLILKLNFFRDTNELAFAMFLQFFCLDSEIFLEEF